MTEPVRALILDDDAQAADFMKAVFAAELPDLQITTRLEPDISGQFDMYYIDNDFNGRLLATELADNIRASKPDALIIAASSHLDAETLSGLLNRGCNGSWNKSKPEELPKLVEISRRYYQAIMERRRMGDAPPGGFINAIHSIRDLLREWNTRFSQERQSV